MPTRIVAIGEMEDITGEMDGSLEDLRDAIQAAVKAKYGDDKNYIWVRRTYPSDGYVIAEQDTPTGTKNWKIPYTIVDGTVQVGQRTEVEVNTIYIPVDEINNQNGGVYPLWKELIAKLKNMIASGEISRAQVLGEFGWNAQQVAGEMDPAWTADVTEAQGKLGKVREALGVSGEMDVVAAAVEAGKALAAQRTAAYICIL